MHFVLGFWVPSDLGNWFLLLDPHRMQKKPRFSYITKEHPAKKTFRSSQLINLKCKNEIFPTI